MHVLAEFEGEARTCRAQAVRNSARRRGIGRERKQKEEASAQLPEMLPVPLMPSLPPPLPALGGTPMAPAGWLHADEAGAGMLVEAPPALDRGLEGAPPEGPAWRDHHPEGL